MHLVCPSKVTHELLTQCMYTSSSIYLSNKERPTTISIKMQKITKKGKYLLQP